MNLKETVTNVAREIRDGFWGIDSNPEHIANFPAHKASCSRTAPLLRETEIKGNPGWSAAFSVIVIGETCQECEGTISFR